MLKWIERQRSFLDFTLSSLSRRRWKNLSLIFIYALVVFALASALFYGRALREEAVAILQEAPEMVVQRMVAGRHDLIPLSYAERIAEIRGVRKVTARYWGYYYHPASRTNYTLMVAESFSLEEGEIEVGKGVLRTWDATEGDRLYFRTHDGGVLSPVIRGTFDGSTELATSDLILTSEKTFRKITGVPEGVATDLAVQVGNPRESRTISEKIVRAMPDVRPILREEILRTYASLFDWRTGYMFVLLIGALMAFFIFAWEKATGPSAEERTEIGILKGLGWDTSDILSMKFWEGCVISLSAFLIGVTGAYVHVFMASAPLFAHALKGWSVLYPDFKLHPSLDAYQLAVIFFISVVPYTMITIVPTWRISTMEPDTVMRQG